MDADQFVPISIIAGFNQIKKLTRDITLVTEVLRGIHKGSYPPPLSLSLAHCQFANLKGARSANNITFAFLEKNMSSGTNLKA